MSTVSWNRLYFVKCIHHRQSQSAKGVSSSMCWTLWTGVHVKIRGKTQLEFSVGTFGNETCSPHLPCIHLFKHSLYRDVDWCHNSMQIVHHAIQAQDPFKSESACHKAHVWYVAWYPFNSNPAHDWLMLCPSVALVEGDTATGQVVRFCGGRETGHQLLSRFLGRGAVVSGDPITFAEVMLGSVDGCWSQNEAVPVQMMGTCMELMIFSDILRSGPQLSSG